MKSNNERTAVIVGAGFSRNAGIPAYSEIMKIIAKLLDKNEYGLDDFQKMVDSEITKHIQNFLRDVFDCDTNFENIPSLEQVFTFMDLSTNTGFSTGHNLGKHYYCKY